MSKIIVGIHGLSNKPEKELLKNWWIASINEGLSRNGGIENPEFEFTHVYWANLLHSPLLHQDENGDPNNFDTEPYREETEPLKTRGDTFLDDIVREFGDLADTLPDYIKRFFGFDSAVDPILKAKFEDLHHYYNPSRTVTVGGIPRPTRDVLQAVLADALKETVGKQVMLIAHSMGSIIAYDVLRMLGRDGSGVIVDTFVTIGSPLGFPVVKARIAEDHSAVTGTRDAAAVRTPTVVAKRWLNFADRMDPIAVDAHLSDDFGPNRHGVRVRDDLVNNQYRSPYGERKPNHHKLYGYLRSPEVSACIRDFLAE